MSEQTSLLLRRGTTAEIEAMVGQPSEPIHNVTNDDLILGANKAIVGGKQYVAKAKTASSMGYGVTSGNSIQVTIDGAYVYEEKNKFEFVQDVTALGPVTISVNNGENLPCVDTSGASIDFEEGKIYVGWKDTDGVSVFQLAVRGSDGGDTPIVIGGTKFSHPYNGIDTDVQDEDGQTVTVSVDEKVYFDGDCELKIVGSGTGTPIDRTTPVEVVDEAYSTEGNGSRKLVMLDNGWLVSVFKNISGNLEFYKSTDNGLTWSILTTGVDLVWNNTFSIASYGNNIYYTLQGSSASSVSFGAFDATTVGATLPTGSIIESIPTAIYGVSIAVAPNGDLHATWSCKTASYPNSTNIRYSKSVDGGLNWATVTQITFLNTTGQDVQSPSIIINDLGNPVIITQLKKGTPVIDRIYSAVYNGNSWDTNDSGAGQTVYLGDGYTQSNPSADVLSDGTIVVAWEGRDAAITGNDNIFFSQSTDNGVSWSAKESLTSSPYSQQKPSITRDLSDNISVVFYGGELDTITQLGLIQGKTLAWGARETLTAFTSSGLIHPNTCNNFRDFTKPLTIFKGSETNNVEFFGLWGGGTPEQIFKKASEAVTIDDVTCTIGGTLLFSSPIFGNRVTGFKSDKDLITI